jgi:hypothetical protein
VVSRPGRLPIAPGPVTCRRGNGHRPARLTGSRHHFPHLAPAGHQDIPALADLLGLREHGPMWHAMEASA